MAGPIAVPAIHERGQRFLAGIGSQVWRLFSDHCCGLGAVRSRVRAMERRLRNGRLETEDE